MNQAFDVSIVIPTRNECQNVSEVLRRLGSVIGTSTVEVFDTPSISAMSVICRSWR